MEKIEGDAVNNKELVSNLSTDKQLQQVRQLLDGDPKNSEYLDMEKELVELIELTEELLETTKQSDSNSRIGTGISTEPSSSSHFSGNSSDLKSGSRTEIVHEFPVGTKIQAFWSEDGEWYDETVEGHTVNGYYICYDGWGNKEVVDPDNVRSIREAVA